MIKDNYGNNLYKSINNILLLIKINGMIIYNN
jgi:hypothetical protein